MSLDLSGIIEIQRDMTIASAMERDEDERAIVALFILGSTWRHLKHRRSPGDNDARRILLAACEAVTAAGEAAIQKRIDRFMRPGKQRVSARGFRSPLQVNR